MELEKLKEFIENAEGFKDHPACREFAAYFERLIELMDVSKEKAGILDSAYFEQFEKAFKEFWESFDRTAMSFGIPPEILKANLNNPEFFSPEQWNAMMALKQEILGEKPAQPKKLKRKKKESVRI